MMEENNLTRRGFLGGAAVASAVAAFGLAGCAPSVASSNSKEGAETKQPGSSEVADWLGEAPVIDESKVVENVDCEVLVIGAGTAGWFAAASAAENGAKVLLIEKGGSGNNVRSSALGAVGTKLQKEQGIEIDKQAILNDFARYAQSHVDLHLFRNWLENSGEAIDWYTDLLTANGMEVQLEWATPPDTFYLHWPIAHGTNGLDYGEREGQAAGIIEEYIKSFDGCDVRFSCPMVCLITDESNKVVGAYASPDDDQYVRINASKGVVVATGGYAQNKEMYGALQPERLSALGSFDAFPSCTGDGIKALLWAGAQMEETHTSMTWNRCIVRNDTEVGNPYETMADYGYFFMGSQPFLYVKHDGTRFMNESAPFDFAPAAASKFPKGQRFWHEIWDADWKADVDRFHTYGCATLTYREGADHDAYPGMLDDWIGPEMEEFVEAGLIQKADTLEELAEKLEITDVDAFLATCERYNELYDKGMDEDYGKESYRLSQLRTPPFYGAKNCGITLCTLDGVRVNDDLHPFDAEGNVIEGVYVVGNDQGGFYSYMYPNTLVGVNAGRSATMGRMVGKALAAM
ncbi:MAG: FAD-dependent oxidoreductase [Slackia sp.]|nr:FAD-dependent oxidoreductase [Slackia sp.]